MPMGLSGTSPMEETSTIVLLCYLLALLSDTFILCLGLWKELQVGLWISGWRHVTPAMLGCSSNILPPLQTSPGAAPRPRSYPTSCPRESHCRQVNLFSLSTFLSMVSCTLSSNPNIFSGSRFWKQKHENHSPEAANNKACCIPEQ